MQRRDFIKVTAAGAGLLATGGVASVATSCSGGATKGKGQLNLALQIGVCPEGTLNERLDFIEQMGCVAFEPTGKLLLKEFDEISRQLKARELKLSTICAGFDGFILAEDEQKDLFDKTMREIVAAAGQLGSPGVIMVPAFNSQKPCMPHTLATRNYLCEQLHELGEYALSCGTSVILEPLNRREAFYLRLVSDAAAICRDAKSEGVKCMGDFWHMQEETSDYAAFMAAGKYLAHVHIASRASRIMPGEDGEADNYVDGFRALKQMGYQGHISFECGSKGDKAETIPAALQLIREQWAKA